MIERGMKLIEILHITKAHPVQAVAHIRRLETKLNRIETVLKEPLK